MLTVFGEVSSSKLADIEKRLRQTNLSKHERDDILTLVREELTGNKRIHEAQSEYKNRIIFERENAEREIHAERLKMEDWLKQQKAKYEAKIRAKKEELKNARDKVKRTEKLKEKMESAKKKFETMLSDQKCEFERKIETLQIDFEHDLDGKVDEFNDLIKEEEDEYQIKADNFARSLETGIDTEKANLKECLEEEKGELDANMEDLHASLERKLVL